jgi:hypothetical protein
MDDNERGASAANDARQFPPEILRLTPLEVSARWRGSISSASGVVQLAIDAVAKDADSSRKG